MTLAQDNRRLVDRYLAAYTAFDVEAMCALLAPGVVFENHADDRLTASATGIDDFRALAMSSAELFSSRSQRIVSMRVEDDRAIAVIAFEGVLARDIDGGPTAGTNISLMGKTEFEFRDGRIIRIIDRS